MCFLPGIRFDISNYILSINSAAKYYEVNRLWGDRNPIFELNNEHKTACSKILPKLGILTGAPYVCIHTRSLGYSSEDDAVHSHRNFSLTSFNDAIKEILNRGYYCILMGDESARKLIVILA